jgi:hypothetical protein
MLKRSTAVQPVQETVKHKTDNLEWESIPEGDYQLEFRLHCPIFRQATIYCCVATIGISLASPILAWLVEFYCAKYLQHWGYAVGCLALGIALAVRRLNKPADPFEQCFPSRAFGLLCVPLAIWTALAMCDRLSTLVGGFSYAVFLAFPAAFVAADNIATHAIYWSTANLHVNPSTMVSWRKDWRFRFIAVPRLLFSNEIKADETSRKRFDAVWQARLTYAAGILWLAAAIILPQVFMFAIGCGRNPNTLGIQVVCGFLFGLLIVGILRAEGRPWVALRTWQALRQWLHQGEGDQMPPWVFHSPCGTPMRRRLVGALAIAMLSIVLTHLVGGSLMRLACAVSTGIPASIGQVDHPTCGIQSGLSSFSAFATWTSILAALLAAALLPFVMFFLSAVIVIGPIVTAYYDALETQ